jgi:hypothetical protein
VIIVAIITSIEDEPHRDLHTRTDFIVHHSRREAAGPFCLANELYEFYFIFIQSLMRVVGGRSPTHKHPSALYDSSI